MPLVSKEEPRLVHSELLRDALVSVLAPLVCALCVALLLWPPPPSLPSLHWQLVGSRLALRLAASEYRVAPPARGEARDVVFTAERTRPGQETEVVELHVLRRGQWPNVLETRSFGVSWEGPPRSRTTVPEGDRVTGLLRDVVAELDTGSLTPEAIPLLPVDSSTPFERALRGLERLPRFLGVLSLALLAMALSASRRAGVLAATGICLLLSFALRFHNLGFPFEWDQDIQRIFSSLQSAWWVLSRLPLVDRHPPGFYLLLHFVPGIDHSELSARGLAALLGSLYAPALILLGPRQRFGERLFLYLLALGLSLSPVAITRAREVSELSMHALASMAFCRLLLRGASLEVSRKRALALALLGGLLPWIYYVGAAVLALLPLFLAALDRPLLRRWFTAWMRWAFALALPGVLLGAYSFLHDLGARRAAESSSGLAWGAQSVGRAAQRVGLMVLESVGYTGVSLVLLTAAVTLARRDRRTLALFVSELLTIVAVIALAPYARVQPYYAWGTALTLLSLSLALFSEAAPRWQPWLLCALGALFAAEQGQALVRARSQLFSGSGDAFGPDFARVILSSSRRAPVVALAHYDVTLLVYYLAQQQGVALRAVRSGEGGTRCGSQLVQGVVAAHQMSTEQQVLALGALRGRRETEDLWIVWRFAWQPEGLGNVLRECHRASETGSAALLFCPRLERRPPP